MLSSDSSSTSKIRKKLDPWEIIESHEVRLPDGTVVDDYYYIRLQAHTVIIAKTTEGQVIVERQYKHGAGKVCLVLPAGFD